METESGHTVLSVSPNPIDLRRPNCRVMVRPDGTVEPEDAAAMWDPMPASERIVRVIPPEEQTLNIAEYLAA
jgi:hypothetical protein